MPSCRFYTDRGSFVQPVESIPVEGDTVDLGGQSYLVQTVKVLPLALAGRFGHNALAFCSPNHEDTPSR